MRIKCWGSRGSFPVCGPEFVRYGGGTSCVEVESGTGDLVLLDSGTGIRDFANRFTAAHGKVVNIVYSHYHLDHIMGFPYFSPIYDEQAKIRVYGNACAGESAEGALRKLMRTPYFPVDFCSLPAQITFQEIGAAPFNIGSLRFTPIRLNHPNGGCGFRIEEAGKAFVFLTDNELEYGKPGSDAEYFEVNCYGADLLMHDGEYTDEEYERYESWGHSKYSDVARLAIKSKVKKVGIYHINANRTDDRMDEIVEDAKRIIADSGANIECFGVGAGWGVEL